MTDRRSKDRQVAAYLAGRASGPRCGERTRGGGVCVLTLGHSTGHRKAPGGRRRRGR